MKQIYFTNCSIKFSGNIDEPRATFPLTIHVNIKYQSVHGVTINIIYPINNSEFLLKNNLPKIKIGINIGVHMKLIIIAINVNFKFFNELPISFNGICINTNDNINIKNEVIKYSEYICINSI